MAEEIIDLRDRIEKMRIEMENEATQQIPIDRPLEIREKTNDPNVSLSMKKKEYQPNQVNDQLFDNENNNNKYVVKSETFPAVSLSVKNPVSSKVITSSFL